MKKLLLMMMLLSTSLLAGEQIDKWFNEKFGHLKPYLNGTYNTSSYGVSDTKLKITNYKQESFNTYMIIGEGGFGEEYYVAKYCFPDIDIKKETGEYTLNYNDFCIKRFTLSAYKKVIDNYMHNMSNVLSNAVNGTYKEPTEKKFIVIPERDRK